MLSQQMQVFLQVAECGSFTKAARRLLVTPASVMKHINTLEDRLGVTLFKRDKKGVVLTAAGRSLVQDGKKMAALANHAAARAKRAEQEEGIVIRVGSSLLNPSKVLTDLWAPLRTAYPQYKFHIVPYTDTKEERFAVIGALGETFDLLVGTFDSKTIRSRANYLILGDYRLCVAVPEGHPLAAKKGALHPGPAWGASGEGQARGDGAAGPLSGRPSADPPPDHCGGGRLLLRPGHLQRL